MKEESIFEKFDKHAIIYLFIIAFVASLFAKPADGENAALALAGGSLLVFVYYVIKAIFITGDNILNWNERYPGESMFKAGGLTEYDTEFAKAIGKAVGDSVGKPKRNSPE